MTQLQWQSVECHLRPSCSCLHEPHTHVVLGYLSLLASCHPTSNLDPAHFPQALCNLALSADEFIPVSNPPDAPNLATISGSYPGSAASASTTSLSTFHSCIGYIIPQLRSLMIAEYPDAALSACQTLANLARSPVLVSQVLSLIGALPSTVHHIASACDAKTKQHFAQFLLNATLHAGTVTALDACGAVHALLYLLEDCSHSSPAVYERCLCTMYNILRESPSNCVELAQQPTAAEIFLRHLQPPSTPNSQYLCALSLTCMYRGRTAASPREPAAAALISALQQLMIPLPVGPQATHPTRASALPALPPQLSGFTYGDVATFLDAVLTAVYALCAAVPPRDCTTVYRTLTQQVVSRLLQPAPPAPAPRGQNGAPSLASSVVGIPQRKRALSASIGLSALGFGAGLGSAAGRESVKQLPLLPPAIPEAALHLLRFLSARCEEAKQQVGVGEQTTGLAECMLRLLQQDCNNLALLQVRRTG